MYDEKLAPEMVGLEIWLQEVHIAPLRPLPRSNT